MVEGEAEALQHGHEDADVLPVGGGVSEHAGQPAETLLQRVYVQGHPAVAGLPKKKTNSASSKPVQPSWAEPSCALTYRLFGNGADGNLIIRGNVLLLQHSLDRFLKSEKQN